MRSLALSLLLCLALVAPAMAQGPSQDGYIQEGPQIVDQTSGNNPPGDEADAGTSGTASGLPFTGMDLVLVAALGAGLLGAGLGMRQLTRKPAGPAA